MEWEKEGCAEGRIEVRERWGGRGREHKWQWEKGRVRDGKIPLLSVCRVRGRVRALDSHGSPPVSPVPCFLAAST